MSDQFFVENGGPGQSLIRVALVGGETAGQYFASWEEVSGIGPVYRSDGTVAAAANALLTLPSQLLIPYHIQTPALQVDQSIFIAPFAVQVAAISYIHAVAETTAPALFIQVTKDSGTQAPGAGTDLLINNAAAGFDGRGAANTLQTGLLTAATADLQLVAGDRLSLDYSAAATELAGVTLLLTLQRL